MKWISHKICNAAIVYSLTGDFKATLFSTIGSILPDVLEFGDHTQHRTITHYPIVYIIPLVLLLPYYTSSFLLSALFWVCIGCIVHLLLDVMSKGGIPLLKPFLGKKFALNFYVTNHFSEFCLTGLISSVFMLLGRANGFVTKNHFAHQLVATFHAFKQMIHAI